MEDSRLVKLYYDLEEAIKSNCADAVSVAFSGGIDSSLVAFITKKYCEVELIAVGLPESHDLKAAKSAAELIDMELKTVEIDQNEMVSEAEKMQSSIKLSRIETEFMLPFWIAAKYSTNKIFMCGQGADELFGGYARFRKEGSARNLSREIEELKHRIPEREEKISQIFNLKLFCPYLDDSVVNSAEAFTIDERIGDTGKVLLRNLALKFELPKRIVERKKKAAQYGSGSQKALRNVIKHRITFEIDFESEEIARAVAKATEPENKGWVETTVIENKISAIIKAKTLGSLREAAEDFMACISVAEKVSKD